MSGTLVPMSTGVPAGTHQNLKILGTAGYRENFRNWVPLDTGYRIPTRKKNVGTGYRPDKKNCGYRLPARKKLWVPMSTGLQPEKFSTMATPG